MPSPMSLFIESGVDPLLADLATRIELGHAGAGHPDLPALQGFISDVFRQTYGATLSSFYPNLIRFDLAGQTRAVVGYRPAATSRLFLEQYLDDSVEQRASALLGETLCRNAMVEVGSLAITDPGLARWVISATTAFLASAGLRWVLFTATRPLANAFRRLGLKPLPLAPADPLRLPDRGAAWGSYYDGEPQVYLGDIHAGCSKLRANGATRPNLQQLLLGARALADEIRPDRAITAMGACR